MQLFFGRAASAGRKIKRICSHHKGEEFIMSVSKSLSLGIIGFFIAGQFVTVAYYPFFWINLAFIVSLHSILTNKYQNNSSTNARVKAIS